MPWQETLRMDQRTQFIAEYLAHRQPVTELAERFQISRKTAYKWIARYDAEGPAGLHDRSRRPHTCPHATPRTMVAAVVDARQHHPRWGAKKLLGILHRRAPTVPWPARSTVCDLLKRARLIPPQRRRPRLGHPGRPLTAMTAPNGVWTADFKGHFKMRDGHYCYPLTLVDGFSRFVLACQGRPSTASVSARPVFHRAFAEYGLPERIRTDNGVPFATTTLGRLSPLAVWWIRLGIHPELIAPAHPEQNGRHERMHRTLKAETTRPPAANLQAQQTRFNRFRIEYNEVRPHEALAQATPASVYQASRRPLPRTLPPLTYPAHFEVRRVSSHSGISWKGAWIWLTHVLAGEDVGLEAIDDGIWDIYFGPVRLGRLDERRRRVEPWPPRARP